MCESLLGIWVLILGLLDSTAICPCLELSDNIVEHPPLDVIISKSPPTLGTITVTMIILDFVSLALHFYHFHLGFLFHLTPTV